MEGKAFVSCVATLLLLQFAEWSQASEASGQNVANRPEGGNVTAPSPTTDVNATNATVVGLKPTTSLSGSQQPTKDPEEKNIFNDMSLTTADQDGATGSALEREGRIFALYTTKNKALFVTTTKTALSTCFSATNSACTGRKRRKRVAYDAKLFKDTGSSSIDLLDPSLGDDTKIDPARMLLEAVDRRTGKGSAVTIWTTLFSTFTITTTFYIPGTTVSISGMCSLPGLGSSCFG